MKKSFMYPAAISTMFLLLSSLVFAQDNRAVSAAGSLFVISAKAGGVNYVEGKVAVAQQNGKSGYLLKGDDLEIGDKVSTGAGGKAEILLNPGSYVRLTENSDFEFTNTSLDDLGVKLTKGSAMFEVITDDDFDFFVKTPQATFKIVESGVYRVDVLSDGSGKISVWKGKAEIGEGKATTVKSGREATIKNEQVTVAKFDRDTKDELVSWSKTRAKELAKVNSRLERDNLRNNLLSSFNNNNWNFYNSYGLWVFDRLSGNHCFLPFGYGWSSPYGFGFGRDIFYFRLPRTVYYQTPTNVGNTNRRINPPSERVQRDVGRKPTDRNSDRDFTPSPSIRPTNRTSPPSPAPSVRPSRKTSPIDN